MLKYIALLFNTVALLIYQFFFAEGITVTQKMPSSVKPESEFVVELTINKGSTSGFAKLQQDLPEGFTAVQDDNNGASFTFSNQSVKLIWMSLPADKEFKVKYKVKVAAGVSGDKTIGGKFSYVADNVKQSIDISPATINVEGAASQPIVTNAPPENKTPEPTNTTATTENTSNNTASTATNETASNTTTPATTTENTSNNTTANTTTPAVTDGATSSTTQEPSSIKCERKIKTISASEAIIEVIINKGNASGFAKLIETIPAGCTASLNEAQGASFTFADGKAKFVWVSMPTQPEYKISYKLAISAPAPGQAIDGVFSYIENDETKKFVIASMPINSSSAQEPVVTNATSTTENNTSTSNTTATTTPENKTPDPVNTTATNNTNNNTTTNNNTNANNENETKALSATTIPAPQTAVNYKVQIAALQRAVSADALATRYGINENINTEMADGFTKYTVGTHNEYRSARDAREVIKNKGVAGPFVTAYNSGKRITVQEALMITSQKWYR
ncbi:MAG: hypothetical protein J0L87_05820 [Bacteroidetes bacterium]|nr:hypothetical protein [Bacteroidota bacterium]